MNVIVCRARVSPRCLDGLLSEVQFGEDAPLSDDGTYDGTSIVCDECYVALLPLVPSRPVSPDDLHDATVHARVAR